MRAEHQFFTRQAYYEYLHHYYIGQALIALADNEEPVEDIVDAAFKIADVMVQKIRFQR